MNKPHNEGFQFTIEAFLMRNIGMEGKYILLAYDPLVMSLFLDNPVA